jgi:hypothetical protein
MSERNFFFEWLTILVIIFARARSSTRSPGPPRTRSLSRYSSAEPGYDLPLDQVIGNTTFEAFLKERHASENLYFIQDVAHFKAHYKVRGSVKKAGTILDTYVNPGSAREVNLSSAVRASTQNRRGQRSGFDEACSQITREVLLGIWIDFQSTLALV